MWDNLATELKDKIPFRSKHSDEANVILSLGILDPVFSEAS